MHKDVCSDPALPDEFLVGRVGYLFALLFVKRHLGEESVNPELISMVRTSLLQCFDFGCCDFSRLKGHCIEFKYYADGIHSGLTPPG